ncbi:hypothetical protein LAZ67_1007793 [Cordylochernes scorpioides]|uniref:Ig-like domain-containing protein n=1 Tax=Cordylochernes scorpioides TaxID=51811 RepID=A0ABY6K355_9ARAC|nr:hypothetical protein LAZ67_1007793 [Cordylochernes scorpioides]
MVSSPIVSKNHYVYNLYNPMCAKDPPKIRPLFFRTNIMVGEKESTACTTISGSKPFKFEWKKDGGVLKRGVETEKEYSMIMIDPVGLESMGNYSCTVSNKYGSDVVTAKLTVRGKLETINHTCGSMSSYV